MGSTTKLAYGLPLSCFRAKGQLAWTTDTVLETERISREGTLVLDVTASEPRLEAEIEHGVFRDTSLAFEFTEDRQLVSGSVETTGQAGVVLAGIAGLGGAVVGGLIGGPAATARPLIARFGEALQELAFGLDKRIEEAEEPTDPEGDAYAAKYPLLAELRRKYTLQLSEVDIRIVTVAETLIDEHDAEKRATLTARLRSLRQLSSILKNQLQRVDEHFKAWRATTITTRAQSYELVVNAEEVARAEIGLTDGEPPEFRPASGDDGKQKAMMGAQEKMRGIWDKLGLLVAIEQTNVGAPSFPTPKRNQVFVRVPRRVALSIYRRGDDDNALLIEHRPVLLMDSRCNYESVEFKKSLFGRRNRGMSFSSTGAMTKLTAGSTSSAAGLAESLGALPAKVAGGMEQSKKIIEQSAALRAAGLDQELDKLKKEVELKQQQITKGDLLATEAESAELARLKQQAEMLEKQKTIQTTTMETNQAAVEIAGLKQQIDRLNAKRDLEIANRDLAAETDLSEIRLEIERLRAEFVRRNPDRAGYADPP